MCTDACQSLSPGAGCLKWKKGAFQKVHQAVMPLDNVDGILDITDPPIRGGGDRHPDDGWK